MATALEVLPEQSAACTHEASFNPYKTLGGFPDDMTTEQGRCVACDSWLEITTWLSTGYSEERALDSAEIAELRRSVWL